MKNNILIKILLGLYIVVGISGIISYISPSRENTCDNSFDVSYFTAPVQKESPKDSQTDGSEEFYGDQNVPTEKPVSDKDEDVFVLDIWLDRISEFVYNVDYASDEEQEESSDVISQSEEDENIVDSSQKELVTSVIIDTDFASDADDVVALRLAMCFQDQGMLNIQGISLSTTYSRTPLAVHALCKQDGYGNIPVAMDTSGNGVQVHTNYVDVMYEMPKNRDDYEQPVQMYRRLLSESDTKVNIITLGFLQNIEALMNSSPDQYSNLNGMELIAQKVDTVYIGGGNSTGKPSFNFYWTGEKVIKAAQTVARNLPVRVVFLQSDLSDDTFCGQLYSTMDSHQRDIVTKALKANGQSGGVVAWDVFSIWCAVQDMNENLEQSFLEIEQGNQYISNTGATQWTYADTGSHYRIKKNMQGAYYSELMNNMLLQKYNSTHTTQS